MVKSLPLSIGLLFVAGVWVAGGVWSFSEQRDFAANRGFDLPALLPLTIDGLALSLAVVAWSASLDGRAAVQARLGTFAAITASAVSNGTWAAARTSGDVIAVTLAAGVPMVGAVAFETLLSELRKGVHRRRGLPAPVAVAAPRVIRLVLAPWPTFRDWRAHVLTITAPDAPDPAHGPAEGLADRPAEGVANLQDQPAEPSAEQSTGQQEEPGEPSDPTASTAPTVGRGGQGAGRRPGRQPGRQPGRPAGRSTLAVKVARLAEQHPDWTAVQIATRAGCTTRTVRRHLNRPALDSPSGEVAGDVADRAA